MNQYHRLYTPADSAVVFIDHQPQMLFGVASMDRASLINNVTLLAKCAKEFNVPAVLRPSRPRAFPVMSGRCCSTFFPASRSSNGLR